MTNNNGDSIHQNIKLLPSVPGVYQFLSAAGKTLYVGKARNLKKRVSTYFNKKGHSPRICLMLSQVSGLKTTVVASENEALLLENNLIKSLKPRYNVLFRDDKSYPLLRLSAHPYSRLMFYRGAVVDGDSFGPFPDSAAVRESIDIIQRVFRLRTCADSVFSNRSRPCLLHAIKRCSAPCVNLISPVRYAADVSAARAFLQGDIKNISKKLKHDMEDVAAREDFETAAALRDCLRALVVVRAKHFSEDRLVPEADYIGVHHDGTAACVNVVMVRGGRRIGEKRFFPNNVAAGDTEGTLAAFLSQHYHHTPPPKKIYVSAKPLEVSGVLPIIVARGEAKKRITFAAENARHALAMKRTQKASCHARLVAVALRLQLAQPPQRVECFDISHSSGEAITAARVVFEEGLRKTAEYRKYKISAKEGGDTAAIYEAVYRCYRRVVAEKTPLPDLLLIDGGIGQVRAARKALGVVGGITFMLVGVAKGAARKVGEEKLILEDGEVLCLPAFDSALHFIQEVRDEAHRFAVVGHRQRRDKKRHSSVLEDVEGIGRKKRRQLISHFGGLGGLAAAGEAELVKIDGIGRQLAGRIYQALH